jgi:hypothetical protein
LVLGTARIRWRGQFSPHQGVPVTFIALKLILRFPPPWIVEERPESFHHPRRDWVGAPAYF